MATGQVGDYVGIAFDDNLGDLDIEPYASNTTTLIGKSKGTGNTERISLAGQPAGTYYLRVYGYANATNPSYTIAINAPVPDAQSDWAEPNDAASAATDLQQVEGFRGWTNLSIDAAHNSDWFQFTTTGEGRDGDFVGIVFDHNLGDLDLALYRNSGTGTPILTSEGTGDRELISLAGQPAGTYYVRVYGYGGDTNPLYSLGINAPAMPTPDFAEPNNTQTAAYDLREVSGQIALGGLSIDTANDHDWFRFKTLAPGVAGQSVRVDFAQSDGDLTLALCDLSGQILKTSDTTGDFEEISLEGRPAGTYYLQVTGKNGATNPGYTLSIVAPDTAATIQPDWAESNDSLQSAYDLRSLADADRTRSVGYWPSNLNYYGNSTGSYILPSYAGYNNLALAGSALNYAGFEHIYNSYDQYSALLFNPANDPTIHSVLNNPLQSVNLTGLVSGITGILDAGHSPLGLGNIYGSGYNPNFSFGYNNSLINPYSQNYGANPFSSPNYGLGANSLGAAVSGSLNSLLSLPGLGGNLFAGLNPGSGFSPAPGFGLSPSFGYNPPYAAASSNGLASLLNIFNQQHKALDAAAVDGLSIHNSNDQDWFRFELTTDGTDGQFVGISFDDHLGDLRLQLCDANGKTIDQTTGGGGDERISLARLARGTYYLLVTGVDGATNPDYSLVLNIPPATATGPDWAESNDTRDTARDLRQVEGSQILDNLSISTADDQDWFEFKTKAAPVAGDLVRIDFDHNAGDLDLEVYDASGKLLDRSNGTGDTEQIVLDDLSTAGNTYYVRVYGYQGATNPHYMLTIVTPQVTPLPDNLEPNNSTATATNLTLSGGVSQLNGLTITAAAAGTNRPADVDYFQFTTTATGTAGHSISIAFDPSAGNLEAPAPRPQRHREGRFEGQ